MSEQNSTKVETTEFRVYKRRWIIFIFYCALILLRSVELVTLNAVPDTVYEYYVGAEMTMEKINMALSIGAFSYIIFIVLMIAVDSFFHSFRIITIFSSFALLLSCTVRLIPTWVKSQLPNSYSYLIIGSLLNQLGSAFVYSCPSLLSAYWFAEKDNTQITSIATQVGVAGVGVGFVVIPLIAPTPATYPVVLYIFFFSQIVLTILLLLFFQNEPPSPPSYVQLLKKQERERKQEKDIKEKERLKEQKNLNKKKKKIDEYFNRKLLKSRTTGNITQQQGSSSLSQSSQLQEKQNKNGSYIHFTQSYDYDIKPKQETQTDDNQIQIDSSLSSSSSSLSTPHHQQQQQTSQQISESIISQSLQNQTELNFSSPEFKRLITNENGDTKIQTAQIIPSPELQLDDNNHLQKQQEDGREKIEGKQIEKKESQKVFSEEINNNNNNNTHQVPITKTNFFSSQSHSHSYQQQQQQSDQTSTSPTLSVMSDSSSLSSESSHLNSVPIQITNKLLPDLMNYNPPSTSDPPSLSLEQQQSQQLQQNQQSSSSFLQIQRHNSSQQLTPSDQHFLYYSDDINQNNNQSETMNTPWGGYLSGEELRKKEIKKLKNQRIKYQKEQQQQKEKENEQQQDKNEQKVVQKQTIYIPQVKQQINSSLYQPTITIHQSQQSQSLLSSSSSQQQQKQQQIHTSQSLPTFHYSHSMFSHSSFLFLIHKPI